MLKLLVGQRQLLALVHDMLEELAGEATAVLLAHRPREHHGHQAVPRARVLRGVGGGLRQLELGAAGFLRLLIPLQIWRVQRSQTRC